MAEDAEFGSSTLFSPSKARIQQAQTKDWAAVDTWLSKKYGSKRPPTFERNDTILNVLLTMANLNDTADEQRSQLERVEKVALQSLSRRQTGFSQDTLQLIQNNFSSDDGFNIVAELIINLDSYATDPLQVGHNIMQLTCADFDTKQNLVLMIAKLAALRNEKTITLETFNKLHTDTFHAPEQIVNSTIEWAKSTKYLKAKIAEYDNRINVTRSETADEVQLVQNLLGNNARLLQRLRMHDDCLAALQDMPTDQRSARLKIESRREHLQRLVEERDKLFQRLTTSEEAESRTRTPL